MCDLSKGTEINNSPQCQYFVLRKKRLCRMTVKPGNDYCGEHEPRPKTDDGQDDTRIPCPFDSKHTCYASKLEKHLSICNARQQEQPDYIVHNINANPPQTEDYHHCPLAKTPLKRIINVIDKINRLYETYLKDRITTLPQRPIHGAVLADFNKIGRTESSLRHLRQASSLLHVVESEGLVSDNTSYVELGAGKGQLSYYAWRAWCQGTGSRVLLVDRASLRHKRDNKLRDAQQARDAADSTVQRIRADLAHLVLERVPGVRASAGVVGYAKHLCGVATDYALRCISSNETLRGVALAVCCHHRCARAAYPAAALLLALGIDGDDFDTLLGIVSWATCGDGRSRERRASDAACPQSSDENKTHTEAPNLLTAPRDPSAYHNTSSCSPDHPAQIISGDTIHENVTEIHHPEQAAAVGQHLATPNLNLSREEREKIGRRAKAILDWGRVQYLNECGFDARLVHYVPTAVSLENVCIVARKLS